MNIGGRIVMFWLTLLIWVAVFITSVIGLFNSIGLHGPDGDKIGAIFALMTASYFLFRWSGPRLFYGVSPWDYVD